MWDTSIAAWGGWQSRPGAAALLRPALPAQIALILADRLDFVCFAPRGWKDLTLRLSPRRRRHGDIRQWARALDRIKSNEKWGQKRGTGSLMSLKRSFSIAHWPILCITKLQLWICNIRYGNYVSPTQYFNEIQWIYMVLKTNMFCCNMD